MKKVLKTTWIVVSSVVTVLAISGVIDIAINRDDRRAYFNFLKTIKF